MANYVSVIADYGAVGNGVTDDTTAIRNAIAANTGNGKQIVFDGGHTFLISGNLVLGSFCDLYGYGATIKTTVGAGDVVNNTIFTTKDPRYATSSTVSLYSNVSPGNVKISVTSLSGSNGGTIAAGSDVMLRLQTGYLRGAQYRVKKVTTVSGHYDLTLDRPVLFPHFAASSLVELLVVRTQGVKIRGFHLTGSAQQYIELLASWDTLVEDLVIDGYGGHLAGGVGFCITSDSLSYNTTMRNIYIDGDGYATSGVGIEQNESTFAEHLTITNTTGQGLCMFTSAACTVVKVDTSLTGGYGVLIGQNGDVYGCYDCELVGGTHIGAGLAGVEIGGGSQRIKITDVDTLYGFTGINVDAISGATKYVDISGCQTAGNLTSGYSIKGGGGGSLTGVFIRGCQSNGDNSGLQINPDGYSITGTVVETFSCFGATGGNGILINSGAKGTLIKNYAAGNNAGSDLFSQDDVIVETIRCSGGSGTPTQAVIEFSGGFTICENLSMTINASNPIGIGVYGYNCNMKISGTIDFAGTPTAYPWAISPDGTSKCQIDDLLVTNSGNVTGVYGINSAPNATVRIGDNVDLSGLTIAGGYCNRGTISLAVGNNSISFPNVKPHEKLTITPRAASTLTVTPVANTGFTVNSSAAVTADWSIR